LYFLGYAIEVSMKVLRVLLAITVLSAGLLGQAPGASQSTPRTKIIDVSKLGPQVGERVPDFTLSDQAGKMWTLQSIMGPKGAMLVFIRSADW
jgi:hypothetical protein